MCTGAKLCTALCQAFGAVCVLVQTALQICAVRTLQMKAGYMS